MERPSRLTHLPSELIGELIYLQDWRDIRDNLRLPEYSRYRAYNHPIWRQLYHSRLSSYPLPTEPPPNYQQQFFWGSAKAEDRRTRLDELAELGYDVVIKQRDLSKVSDTYARRAFQVAAKRGYTTIVKYLGEQSPVVRTIISDALYRAARSGQLDVVRYLLTQGAPVKLGDMYMAARSGNLDLVKDLMAAYGRTPIPWQLDRLLSQTAPDNHNSVNMAEYIMSLFPDGVEPDLSNLMSAALQARNMELAEYLYQRGAGVSQADFEFALRYYPDNVVLHQWLLDHSLNYLDDQNIELWAVYNPLGKLYSESLPEDLDPVIQQKITRQIVKDGIHHRKGLQALDYVINHPVLRPSDELLQELQDLILESDFSSLNLRFDS